MMGDNETNFPYKSLLTKREDANLCKAFANYLLTDIKLSKTQLSKMIQSGWFLGLPLRENVIKPLAKSVLIPLGLASAASAADDGIHKKILGSGNPSSSHNHPWSSSSHNTVLIISNDEMEDIIKIVKSLEDFCLLLKGVTETVQNEVKEQKLGFLSVLLGTFGARFVGNILTRQGINWAGKGQRINRAGERIVRAGYGNNKMDF